MSDKEAVMHEDNVRGRPRRGGFARHCARRWWVYLIVLILIIVLVVLLVIFVAIPKIAQQKIDASELTIQGFVVTNTQSQNYTMSINSTIRTDGSVHATIDGFRGIMYLEDLEPHTSFAEVNFPPTTADSLSVVNITQFTPITNMAAFTTFNTWLLTNDTLRVTVTGDTNVHVSGISRSYGVTYKKTLTIPGLRNFNGTKVTQTTILDKPTASGDNFVGYVTVPNYSIVTFEIGNSSFFNYLLGEEVGTVYIDNMFLRPGMDNNFTMHANISQQPVLTALGKRPYCETGILPFQLRGKDVVNHGQHLSYYADSLASSNQTTLIDIATPIKQAFSFFQLQCPPA